DDHGAAAPRPRHRAGLRTRCVAERAAREAADRGAARPAAPVRPAHRRRVPLPRGRPARSRSGDDRPAGRRPVGGVRARALAAPARVRLLGRHDEEDRDRGGHDPRAPTARARRAVRIGRPGLDGRRDRRAQALHRGRGDRHPLQPQHGADGARVRRDRHHRGGRRARGGAPRRGARRAEPRGSFRGARRGRGRGGGHGVVAELLRLRLRILANGFRRPPLQVAAIVLGLLLAVGGIALFWAGAGWVSQFDDRFVMRSTTVVGAWLSLAALLLPLMFVRRPVMSPRAFLGYPISSAGVVLAILAFGVIGPGILLVPAAFAPVVAWPDESSREVAWLAVPLLFLQTLLTVQLARLIGMRLRRHPRISAWVRALGAAALLFGGLTALVVVAPRVPELLWLVVLMRPFNTFFRLAPEILAGTPFGALWAAPGFASTTYEDPETAWQLLGWSALLVTVLLIVRITVIAWPLRATRRLPGPRRTRIPGWFAHFTANPAGAIAARSMTYWWRDPRYRTVYAVLPAVAAAMLLALWIGGVPFEISVLVPLPVMTLLLAWSTV